MPGGNFRAFWQAGARAALLTAACALGAALCGCGAKPLAERGIVQGIFLESTAGRCGAVVLYADAKSDRELDVAQGEGDTIQQAFSNAVRAMEAEAYYGKTELLVLDAACSYETAGEIKRMILTDLQPTPAIEVWQADLGQVMQAPGRAEELYQTIQKLQKQFRLQSGLEKLGAVPGSAVLPVCTGEEGYAVNILRQGQGALRLNDPLTAQLAACLAGQSNALRLEFPAEQFYLDAQVWTPWQGGDQILFSLYEAEWKPYLDQSDEELRALTQSAIETAYQELLARTGYPLDDPFRLSFAVRCEAAPGTSPAAPQLQVRIA